MKHVLDGAVGRALALPGEDEGRLLLGHVAGVRTDRRIEPRLELRRLDAVVALAQRWAAKEGLPAWLTPPVDRSGLEVGSVPGDGHNRELQFAFLYIFNDM